MRIPSNSGRGRSRGQRFFAASPSAHATGTITGCGRRDCCAAQGDIESPVLPAWRAYLLPLLGLIAGSCAGHLFFSNDLAVAILGLSGLVGGARLAGRLSVAPTIPISTPFCTASPIRHCKECP